MPNTEDVCQKHPEFDPKNEQMWQLEKYRNCTHCCGLHFGIERVGGYNGEYVAKSNTCDNAKTKIGPMSLEQFGHVRHSLGHGYYMSDGPSWYINEETKTIYLECELNSSGSLIERMLNEWKCKVSIRKWVELKTPQK